MDTNGTHDGATGGTLPFPPEIDALLGEHAEKLGGAFEPPERYRGSVGRTMFDLPSSEDQSVIVLLPREQIGSLPSQSLVRIKSHPDGRSYIGIVVAGPFAEPDGLRADSAVVITTTVRGANFMPNFHGRFHVDVMGEEMIEGERDSGPTLVPPRYRPLPNSPVFALNPSETSHVLRCLGDMRLGLAVGHEEVVVNIPSDSKDVLPRHTGILGTTGGGKSTTVAGMVSRFQAAGIATILLDTEGEYTHLNEPTANPAMLKVLGRLGMSAAGVDKTQIFHLNGRETANPKHPRVQPFCLWFYNLAPHVVSEVLELNDAQQDRFLMAYDVTRQLLRDLNIYPHRGNQEEEDRALNWDDQESGYPGMQLQHLLDVVGACLHFVSKGAAEDLAPYHQLFQTPEGRNKLIERVKAVPNNTSAASWGAVRSRLFRLMRMRIFDDPKAKHLPYKAMLSPGQVSIIDLHDTDSAQVNNLAIAELLHGVQTQQEQAYDIALREGRRPTPVVVIIEEAHEFLSAQRIAKAQSLFQQVARIARRGRKRWLGLVFVTQLPQHLPDEVLRPDQQLDPAQAQ